MAAALVLIVVLGIRQQTAGGSAIYEAWIMAQKCVVPRLSSPGTASFGGMFDQSTRECVTDCGDGLYEARGWVDSQNAFGATVRTTFFVSLRQNDDGSWTPLKVDLQSR